MSKPRCCSSTAMARSSRSRLTNRWTPSKRSASCPACSPPCARRSAPAIKLAMVTNQDGLGSESFPQAAFDVPHQFMMDAFSSQGMEFDAVFVCPHRKSDGCDCRKPKTKLVEDFVRERNVDLGGQRHDRRSRDRHGVRAQPRRPRHCWCAVTATSGKRGPRSCASSRSAARRSGARPRRPTSTSR